MRLHRWALGHSEGEGGPSCYTLQRRGETRAMPLAMHTTFRGTLRQGQATWLFLSPHSTQFQGPCCKNVAAGGRQRGNKHMSKTGVLLWL